MTDNPTLLEVSHVRKVYHTGPTDLEILRDVSFRVGPGEMVALMGPSGVGKTTLLNLIGALDRPSDGTVLLRGKDLSAQPADVLADMRNQHLGFVFQFHHLLPEFTAEENITIPAMMRSTPSAERQQRARDLLETFGLEERGSHYPHELSGGEKQRVALCRALINNPGLVLADEPTGNLDRKTGEQLIRAIHRFSREHTQAFVIATHDESIAEQADRILLLEQGEVTENTSIVNG